MPGYALHQCGLYATRSRGRLALRIGRSAGFLRARADRPSLYRVWREQKASGGTRLIEAPREDLKAIQRRIADLLQRVLPPDYGHRHARKKERRHQNRPAEITGIMVAEERVAVPHRHYKKMQHARIAARLTEDDRERSALSARARSLEGQIQRLKRLTS